MINEGKWEINGRVFELLTLDEEAVVSASIGAVEVYRFGDYVTFYLANAQVEGEAFNVRFYFCKGQITDVELHLLRDYGPEWKGKVWEESFLEMLAQVQADWLGHRLSQPTAVWKALFSWGKISVEIDRKGWNASIYVSPSKGRGPDPTKPA